MTAADLATLRDRCAREGRAATYHEALPVLDAIAATLPWPSAASLIVAVDILCRAIAILATASAGPLLARLCSLLADVWQEQAHAPAAALRELAGLLAPRGAGLDVAAIRARWEATFPRLLGWGVDSNDPRAEIEVRRRADAMRVSIGDIPDLCDEVEALRGDVERLQGQLARAEAAASGGWREADQQRIRADAAEEATRQASLAALALEQERDAALQRAAEPPARVIAVAALSEQADEATIAAATRAIEHDRRRGGVA